MQTCSSIRNIMKMYSFDLDLHPMILVLKLDLDNIKMYVCPKNKVMKLGTSKVITQTQTHGPTNTQRVNSNSHTRGW